MSLSIAHINGNTSSITGKYDLFRHGFLFHHEIDWDSKVDDDSGYYLLLDNLLYNLKDHVPDCQEDEHLVSVCPIEGQECLCTNRGIYIIGVTEEASLEEGYDEYCEPEKWDYTCLDATDAWGLLFKDPDGNYGMIDYSGRHLLFKSLIGVLPNKLIAIGDQYEDGCRYFLHSPDGSHAYYLVTDNDEHPELDLSDEKHYLIQLKRDTVLPIIESYWGDADKSHDADDIAEFIKSDTFKSGVVSVIEIQDAS
jgi:hypothetical protein